jgi:hypothetical protein
MLRKTDKEGTEKKRLQNENYVVKYGPTLMDL